MRRPSYQAVQPNKFEAYLQSEARSVLKIVASMSYAAVVQLACFQTLPAKHHYGPGQTMTIYDVCWYYKLAYTPVT